MKTKPIVLAVILGWMGFVDAGYAITVSGTAVGGTPPGTCSDENWVYDTGAGITVMSRTCAMKMGLLADADGNGTPDQSAGSQGANRQPDGSFSLNFWCFNGIAVAATSSTGQICVSTETVYVSKANDFIGGVNLLGEPWQSAVDGCYRTKTKSATWPWQAPPAGAPQKPAVPKTDKSGDVKIVLDGVEVSAGPNTRSVDMVYFADARYSIIPQSAAAGLGQLIGTIDLAVADPELWARMQLASMALSMQSMFGVIQIDSFNVGIGPQGPSLQLLVSNDLNSNFGVMGDNMLTHADYLYVSDLNGPETLVLIPEPATCALMLTSLAVITLRRRLS